MDQGSCNIESNQDCFSLYYVASIAEPYVRYGGV